MNAIKSGRWLEANQICLAQGDAVALNLMFETKADHKRFFKLWDKYLGGMTEVINYHLSPTGWTILFKTHSEVEIRFAYLEQRKKSKKAKIKNTLKDVSRMLSEHFRIFLSQYVRQTNASHGRKGTMVLQRFKKYVFTKWADYQRIFDLITHQTRENPQRLAKYQADETRYDLDNEMSTDSIWKVGNVLLARAREVRVVLKGLGDGTVKSSILRNFRG